MPESDDILANVRTWREALFAEHDYDLRKLGDAMRAAHAASSHPKWDGSGATNPPLVPTPLDPVTEARTHEALAGVDRIAGQCLPAERSYAGEPDDDLLAARADTDASLAYVRAMLQMMLAPSDAPATRSSVPHSEPAAVS